MLAKPLPRFVIAKPLFVGAPGFISPSRPTIESKVAKFQMSRWVPTMRLHVAKTATAAVPRR